MLTWSKAYFLIACIADQEATFTINDTKLYIPVITLSTQDNEKLLEQFESVFRKTTNLNIY